MVFRNQDLRHVDVAILYALGQKDRAQYIARLLRYGGYKLDGKKFLEATEPVNYNWSSTYSDPTLDHEDCPDCRRKRSNITWTGKPPKCDRHSEHNTTWVE